MSTTPKQANGQAHANGKPAGRLKLHTPKARVDLGEFLEREVNPRLTVEKVYTAQEHNFQWSGDKGRGGCCWHESKSGGSFALTKSNLLWYCAGCGCGGGPVQYLHRLNGGTGSPRGEAFIAIVRKLADLAGVPFPERDLTDEEKEQERLRETRRANLLAIQNRATTVLLSEAGAAELAWLASRGFTEDDVRALNIGLYDSAEQMRQHLLGQGSTAGDIQESSAVWPGMEGYVTFPWADDAGRMLTLYGKHPNKKPKTKALPNPEHGGKVWDHTKKSPLCLDRAVQAGHRELIVVEGVTDAMLAQVRGDTRVIACVAAMLSKLQAETLARRQIRSVTIALDPDQAGENGIASCIRTLLDVGITPYVAPKLPDGLDPDDFINQRGIDAWREHVGRAVHGLRYSAQRIIEANRPESGWTDRAHGSVVADAIKFAKSVPPTWADDLSNYFWKEIEEATGLDRPGGERQAPAPQSDAEGDQAPEQEDDESGKRPSIMVAPGCDMPVIEQCVGLLANDPDTYTRARVFVHVERAASVKKRAFIDRRGEQPPTIVITDGAVLGAKLDSLARFYCMRKTRTGDYYQQPTRLPDRVLSAITQWPEKHTHGARVLDAVVTAPTMREDGEIIQSPGYDADARILYSPSQPYPVVPSRPTLDQAHRAAELILDLVGDVPFEKPHHRAAWLAMFLTLVGRMAIPGEVPFFGLTANQPGCGKDLAARLAHIGATGRDLPVMGWPLSEEERDKRILAVALEGDPAILLGNIDTPLGGPTLEKALTSPTYKGRILGVSENVSVPLNAVFIASGNNLTYTSDGMSRRVITCSLYWAEPDPELRKGFKYEDVVAHARAIHPQLVTAGLTILRAYHVAGRPEQATPLGSFTAWSKLIRNAVLWAGYPDPDGGRKEAKNARDRRTECFLTVLRLLATGQFYDACGDNSTTVKELLKKVEAGLKRIPVCPACEDLRDALIGMGKLGSKDLPNAATVGMWFRQLKGKVIGNHRLYDTGESRDGVILWGVAQYRTEET